MDVSYLKINDITHNPPLPKIQVWRMKKSQIFSRVAQKVVPRNSFDFLNNQKDGKYLGYFWKKTKFIARNSSIWSHWLNTKFNLICEWLYFPRMYLLDDNSASLIRLPTLKTTLFASSVMMSTSASKIFSGWPKSIELNRKLSKVNAEKDYGIKMLYTLTY